MARVWPFLLMKDVDWGLWSSDSLGVRMVVVVVWMWE